MKKHFSLLLGLSLVFVSCTSAFGAVHRFDDNEYATTDTWYSIEPHPAYLEGHLMVQEGSTLLGGEFYQNDQTYLGAEFISTDTSNEFKLKASYLTNLGFFAGAYLDYTKTENIDGILNWTLWPGYRYGFDQGYLAFSLDIANDVNDEIALLDIDLDGLYLFQNGKISGEFKIPIQEDHALYLDLQGRLKLLPELVAGLDLDADGNDLDLTVGATWTPLKDFIFDGMIGTNNIYAFSGMYLIEQFGVGLEINSDDYLYLKGKYLLSRDSKLVMKLGLSTAEESTKLCLAYERFH